LGSGRKTLQRQGSSSLRSPRIRNSFEQTEIASFEAGQEFVSIQIPAPSGVAIDGDSNMFAVSLLDVTSETSGSTEVTLGDINKTLVILRRGDIAGRLCFPYTQLLIQGSAEQMTLEILVQRKENCQGPATCNFRTERLSAVPGYDYEPLEGEISFEAGATEAFINVEILPKQGLVQTDFILILTDPDGCDFDPSTDGGIENEILTIVVGPADLLCSTFSTKVLMWFDKGFNLNQLRLGNAEYMEQFTGAFFVNGSLAEQRDASAMDWCFHIICLPWKLTFMFVPPPAYCHGWVCFWMSMVAIAGMTYMIGDLAEVFGCAIGMPDLLTAISVVALGTSMPDLFASRTAAIQDSSADASIVNVTGSNCVNVFLGLGLPWLIGSIYWRVAAWDPRWEAEYPEVASVQRGESVM
jgi:solute carrier family 8 (sodium/calcium exchanger)